MFKHAVIALALAGAMVSTTFAGVCGSKCPGKKQCGYYGSRCGYVPGQVYCQTKRCQPKCNLGLNLCLNTCNPCASR